MGGILRTREDKIAFIKDNYQDYSYRYLANLLGLSTKTVKKYAEQDS